jgi:hypothetical protein
MRFFVDCGGLEATQSTFLHLKIVHRNVQARGA